MTPPWPRGVGLHSCIHTFPSNPQNSPKQPGLRSVLSRSNFYVLIINITAGKILGRIFYVLPYRWGNWDPYTQYTRVCPGSRPQPWSEDEGPHSDSQARALSSTGRCAPALAGWVQAPQERTAGIWTSQSWTYRHTQEQSQASRPGVLVECFPALLESSESLPLWPLNTGYQMPTLPAAPDLGPDTPVVAQILEWLGLGFSEQSFPYSGIG